MKRLIFEIIRKNSFLLKILVKITNKQYGAAGFCLRGLRIRRNISTISGLNNIISNGNNCGIQNSKFYIKGNSNGIKLGNGVNITGGVLRINGNGNSIFIDDNVRFDSVHFHITGNNNRICIKKNCSGVFCVFHMERDNNSICVDEGTTIHGRECLETQMVLDEGSKLYIGKDCMLSNHIQIRTSDQHSVLSMDGARLNFAKDINIGEHCWICMNSMIMKGVTIPPNTVVAAGAVCTKSFCEGNIILAGNPARIVKKNINWDRERF